MVDETPDWCITYTVSIQHPFLLELPCDGQGTYVDPGVRHDNTVESVLYYIGSIMAASHFSNDFAVPLDPRMGCKVNTLYQRKV